MTARLVPSCNARSRLLAAGAGLAGRRDRSREGASILRGGNAGRDGPCGRLARGGMGRLGIGLGRQPAGRVGIMRQVVRHLDREPPRGSRDGRAHRRRVVLFLDLAEQRFARRTQHVEPRGRAWFGLLLRGGLVQFVLIVGFGQEACPASSSNAWPTVPRRVGVGAESSSRSSSDAIAFRSRRRRTARKVLGLRASGYRSIRTFERQREGLAPAPAPRHRRARASTAVLDRSGAGGLSGARFRAGAESACR